MFACERPNEWESQALLGLTAASWCCSRKSCWTCSCLLAASLCVCVSLPRCARLGVGPVFVLSSSAALTLLWSYSEIRKKSLLAALSQDTHLHNINGCGVILSLLLSSNNVAEKMGNDGLWGCQHNAKL